MTEPRPFEVGEVVYYVLPSRANLRPRTLYLKGTVRTITPRRIVVQIGESRRNVLAPSLTRTVPDGAWVQ